MTAIVGRRMIALGLVCAGLLCLAASAWAAGPTLDLNTLSGAQAEKLMQEHKLTSVELTEDYLARIAAINKAGPGLNAVTQIDSDALKEAAQADWDRAHGIDLGPAMGLPILLKDIIDAKGMYTSAGDWALRASFPAQDSGVAKELRAHGVVILGKAGLSEWANSFGSQPSGFSNLTGQVLSAIDTAEGPSGSSSGSAAAASAGLAALTIGTETSGSIISPSTQQADVGLRPTVGLVPGYGIAPIDASQDTAGPIERTVEDAAMTLQSIAEVPGSDPTADQEYLDLMGPDYLSNGDIPPPQFKTLPDYMSALTTSFVSGKRIGYNGTTCTPVPPATTCTLTTQEQANLTAVNALAGAGAVMVPDAPTTVSSALNNFPLPSGYEAHATIDEYYKDLGPQAPVQSLTQEVAIDNGNPQEAEKDGNSAHASESLSDDTPGGANALQYEQNLPQRKALYHAAIDSMMTAPSGGGGPVIAVIGSVPSGPQAGYPELALPFGYTPTQRRNIAVDINGGAYDELNLLGVAYVLEQAEKGTQNARQPAADVDPAAYRCAHTVPAEPFAWRGHCNPDYRSIMAMLGGRAPAVPPFSLETESASQLEALMASHELTSEQLVKDELYRIAISNANGPSIQAVRAINPAALQDAEASDRYRAHHRARGPLEGIPVLVNDSIDVKGLATSGGSIALENNFPRADSTLVAKLEAAGAVIVGDTNITELNGYFDPNMPQGYSSLGGQVLLPSDTNKSVGGSSGGSTAAVSAGYAPLAIGSETSPDSAGLITPAANAGLVALKPTVGLVSQNGLLPVAKSQDSPGPIGQTVTDVAETMNVLAGSKDYTSGLTTTALQGKSIATVPDASTSDAYQSAVAALGTLGATATVVTPGTATAAPSVVPYEFHRDLDNYLAEASHPGAKSLQGLIDYNNANPTEGLKFQQEDLTGAEAVDTGDPATTSTYQQDLSQGESDDRALIDGILSAGGYSAIMVPVTTSPTSAAPTGGNYLVGVGDRAGYPIVTVPAGFAPQNSSTGGDPLGVAFIGTKDSEAQLLDVAYAFEQGVNARNTGPMYMITATNPNPTFSGAPSETNQSMWRCVPGSAFYKPYECNAGDLHNPPLDSFTFDPIRR